MNANINRYWKIHTIFVGIAVGLSIFNWMNMRFQIYPVLPSQGGYDHFLSNQWPGWVQSILLFLHIFMMIFDLPALLLIGVFIKMAVPIFIQLLFSAFFWANVFFLLRWSLL